MKPMLAKTYRDQEIDGWLVSEKLDGVRALWDGARLVSRNGNRFHAPQWFVSQLPAMPLDGELYIGRGLFQETVGVVRRIVADDAAWSAIVYRVFDAPCEDGGFAERLAVAAGALQGCRIASVVEQTECTGADHLERMLADLVSAGAEGCIIRDPDSEYEEGRSEDMLKYKPVCTDEAIIIEHQSGEGRHAGRLGALVCEWQCRRFRLGTGLSDLEREHPPAIGARVTFSFQGTTDNGVPRFPRFVAERNYE